MAVDHRMIEERNNHRFRERRVGDGLTRKDWFDRVYGCLIGQAVGDALGAPAERKSAREIRQRYGRIEDFVSGDPVGTDDTEYAMLTARIILKYGSSLSSADMTKEWTENLVGQEGGFYGGGFSERDAIYSLREGLSAPHAGSDNHEMWSDGIAMRVDPVGVFCAGNPAEAARLAGIETCVSHSRDGVYCGQAFAAAVAQAMTGHDWEEVIATALLHVPQDSWTYREIAQAAAIGRKYESAFEAIDELHDSVSIFYCQWADVAPKATALAFGVFAAAQGEYVPSVLGGANVGRDADTIAAMAGAMAGALHGAQAVPQRWRDQIIVIRGHCIKTTAGIDVSQLVWSFVDAIEGRVGA